MIVAGYEPVSLIDYPGHISSIAFLYGCNLRCRYCHNPHLVVGSLPPDRRVDFIDYLARSEIEYVVITGGEPLYSNQIIDFIKEIKTESPLKIKLDTNGFFPLALERLLEKELIDFVSMDVKAFNQEDLQFITRRRVQLETFYRSLACLTAARIPFELRYTQWKIYSAREINQFRKSVGGYPLKFQSLRENCPLLDKRFKPLFADQGNPINQV